MPRLTTAILALLGAALCAADLNSAFLGISDALHVPAAPGHAVRPLQAAPAAATTTTTSSGSGSGSTVTRCPASVPGGLDCTLYTSMVSAAAAAAVAATADARAAAPKQENLVVQGRGSARAPVSRAQFTVSIEVSSADVHRGSLQDIQSPVSGPYGEVERWSAAAVEQAMNPARRKEVLFCASCVNREAGRRVTSVLNYLAQRNATFIREAGGERAAAAAAGEGGIVGIAPPRTTRMSLSPQYEWTNNERSLASYTGHSSIAVDVPMALASEVMDGLLGAGATSMTDVQLAATPAAMVAAQLRADRAAAQAAVARAQNVLAALKVTGTFPLARVSILGGGSAAPAAAPRVEMMAMRASADGGGFGGTGNVGATVGDDIEVEGSVEIAVSFGDNARV